MANIELVNRARWDGLLEGVKGRSDILVTLEAAQRRLGCLDSGFMHELATRAGVPVSEVYGVASFYSFLSVKPLGKYVIRVCKSVPCYLKNGEALVKKIEGELGIKPGETTLDGRFTLQLTNCIGACDGSPAIMVNDDVHSNLTPGALPAVLAGYK